MYLSDIERRTYTDFKARLTIHELDVNGHTIRKEECNKITHFNEEGGGNFHLEIGLCPIDSLETRAMDVHIRVNGFAGGTGETTKGSGTVKVVRFKLVRKRKSCSGVTCVLI